MTDSQGIKIRKSQKRGRAKHGWLDSYFSFSFADYYDPDYMGFKSLRVINEDRVAPGKGFDTHPHRDMEIISYIIDGELAHKDSMGNGSIIKAGNLQRMTAGTGVQHSEYNPSSAHTAHLLQIWILPQKKGLPPSYEELNLNENLIDGLSLIASPEGKDGALTIHQDARIFLGRFKTAQKIDYTLTPGRGAWIQMIKGEAEISGNKVSPGDGCAIERIPEFSLTAQSGSEFLLFDLI